MSKVTWVTDEGKNREKRDREGGLDGYVDSSADSQTPPTY